MITEVNINKVEARREHRDMIANMKFNINFDDVRVEKENVHVDFTFTTDYEGQEASKNVGRLEIKGNIISKENKKETDEIVSMWKEKKTLPINFAEDVINMLNFECGSRGTLVAYSMGFVAPLPLSRARLQEK
jgi:hypothetical protein